ncbi:MAG: methyltransferase domain-containing protein [Armatimonadota bacterium]
MVSQLACPICASPTREVLWPSARVSDAATVVRCTSCRYIYRAQDTPTEETVPPAFPDVDEPWQGWLDVLEKAVGRGALLNIGTGPLPFLQLARDAGWQVLKIDPDLSGELISSEGRWPAGSFHAVTIWNGLEYSARPASLIAFAAHYLRMDGVLAVRLLNPARMAEWWPAFHAKRADTPPPARLFTPTALQGFLGRYGFRIERSQPDHKATVVLLARYVP